MKYALWISLTLLYNAGMCWVSVRYHGFLDVYARMTLLSAIPTWSLAAYFSKNLMFDSLLYDTTLVVSSPIILAMLGQASTFTISNWIGLLMAVIGIFLVRYGH